MLTARSNLRLTLPAAMLAVALCTAGHAEERGAPARQGGLEAKLEYCKTCHGLSGQGYLGYFPMPRLAPVTTATRLGIKHLYQIKESSVPGFPFYSPIVDEPAGAEAPRC